MEHFTKKINLSLILVFVIFLLFTSIFRNSILFSEYTEYIDILDQSVTSDFPNGINFDLNFISEKNIEDVKLVILVGTSKTSQYSYMDLDKLGNKIVAEYFFNSGSINNFIPPSTTIKYFYEFIFEDNSSYISDDFLFFYHDSRFNWEEISTEKSNVFFYDISTELAEAVSNILDQTITEMSKLLDVNIQNTINLVMYNNKYDMNSAVTHKSKTSSEKLTILGQAFSDEKIVIVLLDEQVFETVNHEITHIISSIATDDSDFFPLWLNEGLSEYSDITPQKYSSILKWGIETENLLPFKQLNTFPGDPKKTILAYGQSQSVVRYLIDNYGEMKIANLLERIRKIKSYSAIDTEFTNIYGFDLDQLYFSWKDNLYEELGIQSPKNKSFINKVFVRNNYFIILSLLVSTLVLFILFRWVKKTSS